MRVPDWSTGTLPANRGIKKKNHLRKASRFVRRLSSFFFLLNKGLREMMRCDSEGVSRVAGNPGSWLVAATTWSSGCCRAHRFTRLCRGVHDYYFIFRDSPPGKGRKEMEKKRDKEQQQQQQQQQQLHIFETFDGFAWFCIEYGRRESVPNFLFLFHF